jgi:hypothetical protein
MSRFCTYFDRRYIPRAVVAMRSLAAVRPAAEIWALGLDAEACDALARLDLPRVHVVSLAELTLAAPALGAAADAATRSFYMTIKPPWIAHALARVPEGELLTYVDADLYFLSDPQDVLAEVRGASVALSPHRFVNPRDAKVWGRFNAGWLSVRNDTQGRDFLEFWRAQCLEGLGPQRSNQLPLDAVPARFAGVEVFEHPGANVAPWNVGALRLVEREGRLFVGEAPLVFYHVSRLVQLAGSFYDTGIEGHVVGCGPLPRHVFRPYLRALRGVACELGWPADAELLERVRWPSRRPLWLAPLLMPWRVLRLR